MLNMGMYTAFDEFIFNRNRRFLLLVYHLYMILTQIILLNMLIAIMAKTFDTIWEAQVCSLSRPDLSPPPE